MTSRLETTHLTHLQTDDDIRKRNVISILVRKLSALVEKLCPTVMLDRKLLCLDTFVGEREVKSVSFFDRPYLVEKLCPTVMVVGKLRWKLCFGRRYQACLMKDDQRAALM